MERAKDLARKWRADRYTVESIQQSDKSSEPTNSLHCLKFAGLTNASDRDFCFPTGSRAGYHLGTPRK